jgi:hypothetical protein
MAEAGVLLPDDRVELIEGEVAKMSPIGRRLDTLLNRQAGQRALVSVQSPIQLSEFSEPQPDVALLRPRDDFYAQAHPAPSDVLLVIEVADTSVEYDREVKLPLYAEADIPQVLIVNLPADLIESYAEPVGGVYQKIMQIRRGESIEIVNVSGLVLSADAILG